MTPDDIRVARALGWTPSPPPRINWSDPGDVAPPREPERYVSRPTPDSEAEVFRYIQASDWQSVQRRFGDICWDIWNSRNPRGALSETWLAYHCGDYARAFLLTLPLETEQ